MSIDHTILGVISLSPCSGYDMKAEFEKGVAGMVSALSFGSIYPRLKHLEQEGLIETKQVDTDGRRKKIYDLTATGWQKLMRWLEESSEYPIPMHDELLLKMLFWGSTGYERQVLIKHLHTRRDDSLDLLNYIAEWQRNDTAFIDEYSMLVLTYMQSRLEAELNWIAIAVEQLERPASLPVQDSQWLAVLQKARRQKALGIPPSEEAPVEDHSPEAEPTE